jgi:hypothetical protein
MHTVSEKVWPRHSNSAPRLKKSRFNTEHIIAPLYQINSKFIANETEVRLAGFYLFRPKLQTELWKNCCPTSSYIGYLEETQ